MEDKKPSQFTSSNTNIEQVSPVKKKTRQTDKARWFQMKMDLYPEELEKQWSEVEISKRKKKMQMNLVKAHGRRMKEKMKKEAKLEEEEEDDDDSDEANTDASSTLKEKKFKPSQLNQSRENCSKKQSPLVQVNNFSIVSSDTASSVLDALDLVATNSGPPTSDSNVGVQPSASSADANADAPSEP